MTHIIVTFRFHEILQQAQDDTENLNFTDYFNSGVGVPPNLKHQADNLAKLGQEFLSVRELIAEIFGAVVAAKPSLAFRNGQMIARCGCQNNGFTA